MRVLSHAEMNFLRTWFSNSTLTKKHYFVLAKSPEERSRRRVHFLDLTTSFTLCTNRSAWIALPMFHNFADRCLSHSLDLFLLLSSWLAAAYFCPRTWLAHFGQRCKQIKREDDCQYIFLLSLFFIWHRGSRLVMLLAWSEYYPTCLLQTWQC